MRNYFKKLKYSSVCFEKHDAERHLHAQVWYDKETNKGDIMKTIRDRICKDEVSDWDNSQKKHAVKIKICYNSWFDNYCADNEEKGEPTELQWITIVKYLSFCGPVTCHID